MKKRFVVTLLFLLSGVSLMSCDSRHVAEKPDTTRPTILWTSPAANATAVAVTTKVTVTFSEAMNATTINDASFYLISNSTGTLVAGNITYEASSHIATFATSTLDHNTTYNATITANVTDAAGNPLASSHSWSFTTIPAPGTLDSSFGTGGKVRMPIGSGNDIAYAAAIQQVDGKIITAGLSSILSSSTSTQYFTIMRFQTDGALDTTFGLYQIGSASYFIGAASCVGLQADGKIIAAGSDVISRSSFTADFLIARYNMDGTSDTTLNSNGTVTMNMGYTRNVINSVAIQSDGKIIVVGEGTNDGITYVSVISRFTTAGILDPSFASNGTTTYTVGTTSHATVVRIQQDGKIVVGGNFQEGSGPQSFYLTRFGSDGTPDPLFSGGMVTASPGTNAVFSDMAILASGQILVAGTTNSGTSTNDDLFVMRYNADGTLDTTFGTVFTDDGNNGVETAASLAVQGDGKIIVAATFHPTSGGTLTNDFAVFRYTGDGIPDTTFGNGHGMGIAAFGNNYNAYAENVQIQQDGKIVVVGFVWNGSNYDIGLSRYWP